MPKADKNAPNAPPTIKREPGQGPRRNARHYVAALTTFQVEDELFRIPAETYGASLYIKNLVYRERRAAPEKGLSDDSPILLKGVTAVDMSGFLDVAVQRFGIFEPQINTDKLISALKLSTLWGFLGIRRSVISRLNEDRTLAALHSSAKFKLAFDYSVTEWMRSSLALLCTRPETVTADEAERIGLERTVAVCRIREKRAAAMVCGVGEDGQAFDIERAIENERQALRLF